MHDGEVLFMINISFNRCVTYIKIIIIILFIRVISILNNNKKKIEILLLTHFSFPKHQRNFPPRGNC